jgi:hypothetical protein
MFNSSAKQEKLFQIKILAFDSESQIIKKRLSNLPRKLTNRKLILFEFDALGKFIHNLDNTILIFSVYLTFYIENYGGLLVHFSWLELHLLYFLFWLISNFLSTAMAR